MPEDNDLDEEIKDELIDLELELVRTNMINSVDQTYDSEKFKTMFATMSDMFSKKENIELNNTQQRLIKSITECIDITNNISENELQQLFVTEKTPSILNVIAALNGMKMYNA